MYLGIDIGTSAVKVTLADPDMGVMASATSPLTVASPQPDHREQHPDQWWQAIIAACRDVAAQQPNAWEQIAGIGLSGQMHGPVLLDAENVVLRPAILWNDGRAHAEAARLATLCPDIAEIAGVPPHAGFPAPKLMWLARAEPDLHARIRHILMPKDWVGLRLHGQIGTDMSDAAGTLWFDQAARGWAPDLAEASGIQPDWLPPLHEGSDIAGRLTADAAQALDLPLATPVAAGGGDTSVGALSVGAVTDDAIVSMGTSGQLLRIRDSHAPAGHFVHSFAHCVPGRWYQMAALLNGARPLQWFADMTGQPIGTLLAEATVADPARTPLFLPYLVGERTPLADPHIRGTFFGLADDTTRGEMMRAVVEGVAYGFALAAEALWGVDPRPTHLIGTGGGLRGDLMAQSLTDVLGMPVHRTAGTETGPALGAARLAALATGGATIADIARPPEIERRFTPAPSARHKDRLERFRALYQALAPLSR